jgi:asparagine synthase (glutamine-hydrolysing)
VVGSELFRDPGGVAAFVEPWRIKADRAGLDRGAAGFGHKRNNGRAIDPAGQECTQRHVGDHPRSYRVAQQVGQFRTEIGFDAPGLDESSYAARIAEQFGTDHHARLVSPADFAGIDDLAAMFDEPFADASALPTWRVCQLARETVTVALSGDGADEAFAGYRRHVFHHREDRVRRLVPKGLRGAMFGGLGAIYPQADWAPRSLRARTTLLSLAINPPEAREQLYSPAFQALRGDYRAEQPFVEAMGRAEARSSLDRAQYADLTFWLPGDILTKVDRTSMAVSLEAREPLLDHRLVEFAASLPESMRLRGGQGKWLMKQTMRRYLPDEILFRPKQGFVTPIAAWLRGPLAHSARAIATSSQLARTGWFDLAAMSRATEAHLSGRADNSRLLWQLLMLEKSLGGLRASG